MTVYLVGAGPGDPGLMTVRGAEILGRADVVVHDRLAEPSLLDLAPASALRIDVGKAPGGPVLQAQINDLLVTHGRSGSEVVRLKGGDPFVFGRGGEEALALQAAGLAFEIVPGITSAIAVPAYAGVPVTHRGLATSFTVVTGHSRHSVDRETNWEALADARGTIVVLMGVAHRAEIAERLIRGGLPGDTPAVAVHWGSRPEQREVRTTLGQLGSVALDPPSTIVIGAVAALDLAWYSHRPLLGRRIIVTRAREQAPALSSRLRDLGAVPVEVPTIRLVKPADDGEGLRRAADALRDGAYRWVCFTSANAADAMFAFLHDARDFGATRVAAIGPGTAARLAEHGVRADLVPARAVAEGLLEAFPLRAASVGISAAVLLPQAAGARPVLAAGLLSAGWRVEVVEAYRTEAAPLEASVLEAAASADAVCFTSASTVNAYLAALRAPQVAAACATIPPVVACIGPVTAAAARAAGLTVTVEAGEHTIDGLLAALESAFRA